MTNKAANNEILPNGFIRFEFRKTSRRISLCSRALLQMKFVSRAVNKTDQRGNRLRVGNKFETVLLLSRLNHRERGWLNIE